MLKPKWKKVTDTLYTYSYFGGVIEVQVMQSTNHSASHFNKWGIVLGMCYWSRDNDKWWDTKEKAMVAVEHLIVKACLKILKGENGYE